jgi:hypothetical protein
MKTLKVCSAASPGLVLTILVIVIPQHRVPKIGKQLIYFFARLRFSFFASLLFSGRQHELRCRGGNGARQGFTGERSLVARCLDRD